MKQGLVLFAHGSRDAEWSRPFERLASLLSEKFVVRVAYLEFMRPSLDDAVVSLAAAGVRSIRLVPVFLGQGGHVKQDLPRLAGAAAARHPDVEILLEDAIGEQPQVIKAIAEAISAGTRSRRRSVRRS